MALVAAQAAAKGLDLRARLDVDLPASLEADSSRARQVLLNLLTNAIKFTDAGAVTVLASYLAGEQRLRLAVADTGCGVPHDKLDRLFERFSQVDGSVSRRHGGTGLGLAICKNLVELMGGEIEVESAQGAGSTFSFTIPAPLTVARRQREAAAPMDLAAADSDPAHILIVDDLPANRELVRVLLEAMGHTVKEVSNGDAAVAAAMGTRFDLILMDLQMPGTDGAAATRRIREASELNRRTPIVALSANVLADQVAQCHAAGMNDHIAKPIKLEELVEKVARWAGYARAERGHARVG
jgi:CheY-like chemotaxis protein/anti-sigma regulatory factor (Ser/Thr protein kinase)